jgi:hypothetical protein
MPARFSALTRSVRPVNFRRQRCVCASGADLDKQVRELFERSKRSKRTYGSPRIRADLLNEGWRVSVSATGSNESTTEADIATMSPVDFEDRITQTAHAA